ncbi:amino acid permease [Roseomonas marmotae]|uniref:Amino acid permease n=1 Tax=Roseomonas marmotae TaxID=2768161 RepID=A0ABS3KAS0_9PROT|nr:amino acid permease [Roseomonas marmotae]MBO1074563.1 amino acid permease [Roseomonas marmotae]QTI81595.1 amino acid permease [Roseomonas marmotae]
MDKAPYLARKAISGIIASANTGAVGLKRSLGPLSIMAMGIGAIVGAGIFVLTGTAAAEFAGPALILSFILAGIACAFVGLCYAELAAMIPVSGSAYTYTYATFGELAAWIIGWNLVLEYALGAATVSVGWSGYMQSLLLNFGLHLPPALTQATGTVLRLDDGREVTALLNLPAALIVCALTTMLILGTTKSTRLNNIMVSVKIAVVLLFVLVGAAHVTPANWTPFLPPNTGEFGHFGWSGVLRGAGVVFFAFIGFDAVSTAAQEAKSPQRDMPIGMLGSLIICTLLYVLVAGVLTGLVSYTELDVADPIARGIDAIGLGWLSAVIKIGAIVGLTTVILVLLYGQSRIFMTISRDGLLPPVFSRIHPRLQTPWLSQMLIGFAVAVMAATLPINVLGQMVSIGTLFAFVFVCGAVLYLRRYEPGIARPFRAPGVPAVPLLGIAFSLLLMVGLPASTWLRLVVWVAIGCGIYMLYGRHHSLLRRAGP